MKSWNPTTGFPPRRAGERKRATRARRSSSKNLECTEESCVLYLSRAIEERFSLQLALLHLQDFTRRASKDDSSKVKASFHVFRD